MRACCDILGILRAKVSRDSSWAESIVKNGFYDYIVAFDIIINRKREMWNAHSKVSVKYRMDPRYFRKLCEGLINAIHKMINNPCTTWCIEVLGFDEIKFRQGRKTNTLCFKVHFGELEDELLLPPNRKQVIYPRNRVFRGERVLHHARREVRRQKRLFQATTKDSPSFGLSHRCSSHQFVVALVPYFKPFKEIISKMSSFSKRQIFGGI